MFGQFFAQGVEVLEDVPLGLNGVVRYDRHERNAELSADIPKVGLFQRVPTEQDDSATSPLCGSPH